MTTRNECAASNECGSGIPLVVRRVERVLCLCYTGKSPYSRARVCPARRVKSHCFCPCPLLPSINSNCGRLSLLGFNAEAGVSLSYTCINFPVVSVSTRSCSSVRPHFIPSHPSHSNPRQSPNTRRSLSPHGLISKPTTGSCGPTFRLSLSFVSPFTLIVPSTRRRSNPTSRASNSLDLYIPFISVSLSSLSSKSPTPTFNYTTHIPCLKQCRSCHSPQPSRSTSHQTKYPTLNWRSKLPNLHSHPNTRPRCTIPPTMVRDQSIYSRHPSWRRPSA